LGASTTILSSVFTVTSVWDFTVILPAPNERDLEDLPQEVVDDLEFVFVEHVSQVFATALLEPKPAARSARR